jgi:hypothetical protein
MKNSNITKIEYNLTKDIDEEYDKYKTIIEQKEQERRRIKK